jgi:hypothetical protein
MSPTARTLKYLREQGAAAAVVERYNAYSRQRHDLFGVFDIVALRDERIVGIQCTSGSNHADRVKKLIGDPECAAQVRRWLAAKGEVEVWSWRKLVKRNKDGGKSKTPRWAGRRSIIKPSRHGHLFAIVEEEI